MTKVAEKLKRLFHQGLEERDWEKIAGDIIQLVEVAERLLEAFPTLGMVAVTRGDHGSLLVKRGEWHEHPGIAIGVADTIGAGDAFTAALTHWLLRGAELATLNEAGNRWGAWVASMPGAMPVLPEEVRAGIAREIEASAAAG